MELVESSATGRAFVATRRIARGEVLLDEAPAFRFRGGMQRVDEALREFGKLEAPQRVAILDAFCVPSEYLTGWADDGAPPSAFPEESAAVAELVTSMLMLDANVPRDERIRLALVLVANAHPCGDDCTGLFPRGAVFNHACVTSNVRTRPGDGDRRIWYAGDDVEAGHELVVSYNDQCSPVLLMGAAQRRHYLLATKLFTCQCRLCVTQLPRFPCQACQLLFVPPGGGPCGACGAAQPSAHWELVVRGEQRLFALLCGGADKLGAVSDDSALELLDQTKRIFGLQVNESRVCGYV